MKEGRQFIQSTDLNHLQESTQTTEECCSVLCHFSGAFKAPLKLTTEESSAFFVSCTWHRAKLQARYARFGIQHMGWWMAPPRHGTMMYHDSQECTQKKTKYMYSDVNSDSLTWSLVTRMVPWSRNVFQGTRPSASLRFRTVSQRVARLKS